MKKQTEVTRRAQALYYKLRAEGLNHSEALNGVVAVVFRMVIGNAANDGASIDAKKGPKRPRK